MRDKPLIPKLRNGNWRYHLSKNDDGTKNGSVVTEDGYCIAKQPRYADDGEWETHAKLFTAVPDMLKYLIEEWYRLADEIEREINDQYPIPEEELVGLDERICRRNEVRNILKEAGAFSEDIW